MTKKDIVDSVAMQSDLSQSKVREVVELTFEAIREALVREGRIELRNFGVFEVHTRLAHKARNPKTGERVTTPTKQVISFKAGKSMEERVQKD